MTIDQLNEKDIFARENDIQITCSNGNSATATMLVSSKHLNGVDVCQGGAIFALADLSQAAITNGEALTVGANVEFAHPAFLGDQLTAITHLLKDGKMPILQTTITNQEGIIIAVATARMCRKSTHPK